jgi:DNA-3-methyladenine glycosylase I
VVTDGAADRPDARPRCHWCGDDPLYCAYHDEEWGTPSRDDRHLFEMLLLEGAQAGLSWITILRKRENYRRAFAEFDAERIARFDKRKVARLLQDPGIVRNKLKVAAAIENARAYRRLVAEHGSLAEWLWAFVDGKPLRGERQRRQDVPARTPLSDRISKDLQKAGFRFVGSTIVYSWMQAVGVVDDHVRGCWRHQC